MDVRSKANPNRIPISIPIPIPILILIPILVLIPIPIPRSLSHQNVDVVILEVHVGEHHDRVNVLCIEEHLLEPIVLYLRRCGLVWVGVGWCGLVWVGVGWCGLPIVLYLGGR